MNYDCNSYTFEGNTVCISQGNQKLGAIPSVSLPWGITCPEDAPCKGKCNMRAIANYPSVKNTYMNNLTCFKENSEWYFFIIGQVMNANRFFRWHVSGDIPNMEYLKEMCRVCREYPNCKSLCFTKKYYLVNDFLSEGNLLPENLTIVFSVWEGYGCHNPYNLPESYVDFKNSELPKHVKFLEENSDLVKRCSHNCSECNAMNNSCWDLKDGEIVVLNTGKPKELSLQEVFMNKKNR